MTQPQSQMPPVQPQAIQPQQVAFQASPFSPHLTAGAEHMPQPVAGIPVAMPSQMPAPQMPAPQMAVPQMPAPQMAVPQMPAPQMAAPQMSAPQMAAPQMPAPQMAAPQMPAPQMAAPQMPAPQMPAPQMTAPQMQVEAEGKEEGEMALPAISIHAFCDRQETAYCINETTRDWRMKRANVKIYMGGLVAATEFYRKENTPSLILVETGLRSDTLFSQLEELAAVCDEGTKVVVIGAANDIRLYRQLMEKGVSDYLVPPLYPLNVIRSLGELYTDPEQPFIGRAVAFFGAKGGTGSSSLAHNTSWILAEKLMQETALVDLDASWGTTGLDFAYDNTSGLEEALAEPDRLDETLLDRIMIRHTEKLSILPTSSSLNTKPVMDEDSYESVVNAVRRISPLSILDLPHYWTNWTSNVLSIVDDVVVVSTPDIAGMRNAKNLIDFLKAQRPNDPDPILILNQVGMSKQNEISVDDFTAMVGLAPNVVLAWDPDSHFEATNDGKMLTDVKSAEQTVQGLSYLANRLRTGSFETSSKMSATTAKKGLLGRKASAKSAKESKPLFSFLKKEKA